MTVPFIDLTREYDEFRDEMNSAINEVLKSGQFVGGGPVEEFESMFASYVGGEYGVGMNSGSDALTLSIQALDIGPGDEVILPSHTFVSSANAIVKNGSKPVFVDIDPKTLVLDPEAAAEAITPDTEAIMPVHLYGQPVPMDPIIDLADDHDLSIIEDASQAHGATVNDEPVGAIGDVGCFSLYPTKNLGAYGDAGIAVTDDDALAQELHSLRDYGRSDKYRFEAIENHSRLDTIQAAILQKKLSVLDELNARRREAAAMYRKLLSDTNAEPVGVDDRMTHVYHLFVIRHERRDKLREFLDREGISTIIHYPVPVHEQPAYDGYEPQHDLSVTETVTSEILSLPIHPWVTDNEIKAVVDAIQKFETRS